MIYDPIMLNFAYAPAAYYPPLKIFPVGGIGIGVYARPNPGRPCVSSTRPYRGRVAKFSPAFPQVRGISSTV